MVTKTFRHGHPSDTGFGFVLGIVQRISFSPAPEYLAKLQQAIRQAHGSGADHEATWMGVEHLGARIWSGSVEVFRLDESAPAPRAFAWSKIEGGELHCYVLLEQPGVNSPREAVRRFLETALEEEEEESVAA